MTSSNAYTNTWAIDCRCPQCGSPAALEETDHIFACPYCRVRLYVEPGGFFRYCIPAPASIKDPLYIPYWRLKGILFSCVPFKINNTLIDATFLAHDLKGMPLTLGVRPQVLKLKFASPDGGRFALPGVTSEQALLKMEASRDRVEGALDVFTGVPSEKPVKPFLRTYTGETMSIIYAPVRVDGGKLYDAVLNRPIAPAPAVEMEMPAQADWPAPGFIPTLCPKCGQDLSGGKKTLVLICDNCQSAWLSGGTGLNEADYCAVPCADEAVYLPFWKMKLSFDGVKLRSYADLARMANIPRAIKPEWEGEDCTFWSPAFKISPQVFLRLSEQCTLLRPKADEESRASMKRAYPVTLPLSEAAESVKISLAAITANKKELFPRLADIKVRLESSLLTYIPFVRRSGDFVHPDLGFGINANTLDLGLNL